MKHTLLVIDDDDNSLQLSHRFLGSKNYTVREARDYATARNILNREQIDLIVLDYIIPDVDGADICRNLRADPRTEHIPIIMWSSDYFATARMACLRAGADAFFSKPVHFALFEDEIQRRLPTPVSFPLMSDTGALV